MSTEFKRHEFLEFFDDEKLAFFDEAKMVEFYTYSIELVNEFKFSVSMLPIEQTLTVTLNHSSTNIPIFKLDFDQHDICKISLAKESNATFLNIYKINSNNYPYYDKSLDEPHMRIMVKPSVAVQLGL